MRSKTPTTCSSRSSFRKRALLLLLALSLQVPLVATFVPAAVHHNPIYRSESCTTLYEKQGWTTSLFPVLPQAPTSSTDTSGSKSITTKQQISLPPDQSFVSAGIITTTAGCIGALTGFFIAAFKLSIESIREYAYSDSSLASSVANHYEFAVFIPALGGVAVGLLALLGESSSFPPGVQGIVDVTDQDSLDRNPKNKLEELADSFRKASAAIFTLGTGCSLGPEGPGVEIGIAASRILTLLLPREIIDDTTIIPVEKNDNNSNNNPNVMTTDAAIRVRRNRLFLACGAAAGVSSGFNAPLAGVFFALEVIQRNLPPVDIPSSQSTIPEEYLVNGNSNGSGAKDSNIVYQLQQESLATDASSITAILTSSVVSALLIRILLGNELALRILDYEIPTPLRELPIFLLLGSISGLTAVIFSQTTKFTKAIFDGEVQGMPEPIQEVMESIPPSVKPTIGGLTCGIVGYFFPSILFFGYETLNGLLLNNNLGSDVAITLLMAKIFATAVSAASGLVGGTLAPSLFMGGMVGASFHNLVVNTLDVSALDFSTAVFGSSFEVSQLPAYTMIGAASFLAAVFRAPLTASLLAFELTKDYDVLVPLLASAGVGTLLCDLVESRIDRFVN